MAQKKHEKVDKKVEIIVDKKSHLLKKPFSMLVAGSSMAGKTTDILSWLINPEFFSKHRLKKIIHHRFRYAEKFSKPRVRRCPFF